MLMLTPFGQVMVLALRSISKSSIV